MVMKPAAKGVVGILLAAGRGTRFGGDKLLAPLAGECVGAAACRRLLVALSHVVAVVRADDAPDRLVDSVVAHVEGREGAAELPFDVRATAFQSTWRKSSPG